MLSFASLALLPLLLGEPAWPNSSMQTAELGGTVIDGITKRPFPSPVPVVLKLYADGECVASAQVDPLGRYSLVSPPGDYWLQLLVGDREQHLEHVLLHGGSWQRDFILPLGGLRSEVVAHATSPAERDRQSTASRHVPLDPKEQVQPTRTHISDDDA
jgi:hypothetical protein